jgi:mono/diheme cytochrome c family protein
MKNYLAGSLCAIIFLATTLAAYLGLGFMEVAADQRPSVREASFMTASLQASVRRRAPQIQNPMAHSDDTLIAGGKLYLNDCVGCHGEPGQPPSDFGATFYPPAPQFPSAGTHFSEAQIFWVAKNGIRMTGMYPQGASYSDSQLWSLAAFISRARNLPPVVVKAIQPPPSK